MRQLIRDRAKAATDKMKECENEGGHLFAPEIIPIVPSVRKAMQAHKKKKTGKKGKIRRRARTAKARKKVFSRLYGDAKKKTRNIQKLRRKQIEEEMMQNTHQPTISHLARVTGTYDRSGDETSTPIHIRLNREHLSRKERSESAARSAALAKVEAEMEHCTFAPTFKGSAKSVKRMIKATRGMRRSKAAAAVAAESPPPPADEEDDDDAPPPADEDEEVEFEEGEVEEGEDEEGEIREVEDSLVGAPLSDYIEDRDPLNILLVVQLGASSWASSCARLAACRSDRRRADSRSCPDADEVFSARFPTTPKHTSIDDQRRKATPSKTVSVLSQSPLL